MNAEEPRVYRIIFSQEDEIYEVYARYISEDNLMGFIEIEELVFSSPSAIVVDPSEERLKTEFKGVKRSYVPMHMVLRIDEMDAQGPAKIKEPTSRSDNVRHLPGYYKKPVTES